MNPIEIIPLTNIPLIQPGDDLAQLLGDAVARSGGLRGRDALVIAQKIVSKAEGRYVDLDTVTASITRSAMALQCDKDPRLIEVILSESSVVVRVRPGLIITRHRLGFVSANAGVDRSNVAPEGIERVLMLPEDPDRSAQQIRSALQERFGVDLGVIIADSHGRPHRLGTVGVAIGLSGCAGGRRLARPQGSVRLYAPTYGSRHCRSNRGRGHAVVGSGRRSDSGRHRARRDLRGANARRRRSIGHWRWTCSADAAHFLAKNQAWR